jgi:hypothetical protein
MNTEEWQTRNSQYLAASLAWLRLRLERLGAETSLPASEISTDEQVAQADMARLATAQDGFPPMLELLSQQLGLSPFEQNILLLCVAMELDTRIPVLCARAQAEAQRPHPTFALALALFDDPSWDALSPERPLRYWRLIEITQPAATPLTLSALRADERIVNYLKGLNEVDDRLTAWLTPVDRMDGDTLLAPSQQAVVETIVERLEHARSCLPVVALLGADRVSKQGVAQSVTDRFGRQLCRLDVEGLPAQLPELETLARLWQRENQLLPLALYLDAQGTESHVLETNASFKRFLSHKLGFVFLDLREAPARLNFPVFMADVNKPDASEQRATWTTVLSLWQMAEAGPAADLLAGQFSLNLADIHQIVEVACNGKGPQVEGLWDACRAVTRPQLDRLAQRLEPRATWGDLVLPDESLRLLRQIAGQVQQRHKVYEAWGFARKMSRGLGLTALFTGESGTGKTMAAEVIANDLRLNLYRIDLSAVVSKYIGETEKNLRQLFDAAEDGGAILFFDEADALFGKRSEVKDSHDRYANIEINYLLQRMEAYRGLAILATNMKSALDTAFMRRLRFIVNFPFPGQAERKAIWQKVFPPEVPIGGLDFDRLARLNLTGGNIHGIALNAAFLAAQANEPVTMPLVLAAARTEFRKLDRPISEVEFR